MTHQRHSGANNIHVRPYVASDRAFVLGLARRLTVGLAAWRDPERMREAALRWIEDDIASMGERATVAVAEDDDGALLGFVTVGHNVHFTGDEQAYVGELAVAEEAEGRGAGQALMRYVEAWARAHGYRFIVLDTGAANTRARGFYARLGYREESVKLVKTLDVVT